MSDPISPSFEELFAELVAMNRADGIDPSKDEPEGRVAYVHTDHVPANGSIEEQLAQPISRKEIDRRFKNLTL